jgi:hydroxyacylglutathione hydrolase
MMGFLLLFIGKYFYFKKMTGRGGFHMKIIEVKGNTFCIDTGMSCIPFYKINSQEIILFDSGWEGEREGLDKLLEDNNFRVTGIFNSHGHIDHVGNNVYFKKKYNCTIAMDSLEAYTCSSEVNLKLFFSNQTLGEVREHFGHMVCKTDIMILPNQKSVSLCGIKFQIIHTPGHSISHICIVTPDDVAYLGDALISYEVMEGAKIPYAFILSEDLKCKEKLCNLKYSKYILAHKGVFDEISELITDNIRFYKNRAEMVYAVIEDGMTTEELFKAVIRNQNISVKSKYKFAVMERMFRSYAEYLIDLGMVKLNLEDGFLKYTKCI